MSGSDEPFVETPKISPGSLLLIFGQSQSGKSYFLKVRKIWKISKYQVSKYQILK